MNDRLAEAVVRASQMAREEREARWEDIELLLSAGETPERVCERLGVSAGALGRQGYRHGNQRIGRIFEALERRQRRAINGERQPKPR